MTKVLSISGIDGSGKSTQANFLKKKLESLNYQCEIKNWIADCKIFEIVEKFESRKYGVSKEKNIEKKESSKKIIRLILSLFAFCYYFLIIKNSNSDFVIFDRGWLDELVHLQYIGVDNNTIKCIKKLNFTDIQFILLVDPKIGMIREGEHTLEYYREKHKLYLNSDEKPIFIYNKDPEEMVNEIIFRIKDKGFLDLK